MGSNYGYDETTHTTIAAGDLKALRRRLVQITQRRESEPSSAHVEADLLLLDYIGVEDVRRTYHKISKYYG